MKHDDKSKSKENTHESWLVSTSTAFNPSESITTNGRGSPFAYDP